MKMKTSELSGNALDYAVAKCTKPEWLGNQAEVYVLQCGFNPSSNWLQGGPIIEREKITIAPLSAIAQKKYKAQWEAFMWGEDEIFDAGESQYANTPIIAAMRCYVAMKLGDIVDIPDDLI